MGNGFEGLRVLSLEARRAREIERLIRNYGGEPVVVPAMRELPLSSNRAVREFADSLLAGRFDLVIFTTGVGVEAMLRLAEEDHPREAILEALRRTKIAARGVKPVSALRQIEVPVHLSAPEPNTWHEVLQVVDQAFGERLSRMRVALQEYGVPNPEMLAALTSRCGELTSVPVYQWGLPEDLGPLRACVRDVADERYDVVLFMTAVQLTHLVDVAREMGMAEKLKDGLRSMVVLSIGPSTTEELMRQGITPDFQPTHPKMGYLVSEAAAIAQTLLQQKRASRGARHN